MSDIKRLNLVYSYPVSWDKIDVLCDYIQNFYDAIGYENFARDFKYYYNNETLVMKSNNIFSKEWLFYFGASTKREEGKSYAGKFGEGFKIASLVATRDLGWDITMESDDWKIHVTSTDYHIADEKRKFLAYELDNREKENTSVLTIKGVDEKIYGSFIHMVNTFEYKYNPLFGKTIYENEDILICHLGNDQEPKIGRIFINYQQRGFISQNIIISNRNYDMRGKDDRDRFYISEYDAEKLIRATICRAHIPAAASYEMLEILREYWSFIGTEKCGKWNDAILTLIDNVAQDKKYCEMFVETYGDKLTANFQKGVSKNRARIAKEWYRMSEYFCKRKIVSRQFEKIGIKDIVQLCEENNGFQVYREPNNIEKECIEILKNLALDIIGDILCYEKIPTCDIINNKKAPMAAIASAVKISPKRITPTNPFKVVYRIENIHLQYFLFNKDWFGMACTSYMHELLHEFGGDSSQQFHDALNLMGLRIMYNKDTIDKYEEKWRLVLC